MKRYYISPIVGDGSIENPYRPKVADHGVSWSGVIPTDSAGKPTQSWTLVVVNAKNHSKILADKTIDDLPDFPLDGKVGSIQNATKNKMKNAMAARGINTYIADNADGYREVIRGIGRVLQVDFDENAFDVEE